MSKCYFIVVAKLKDTGKYEMLFGDYYKQVARDETYDVESGFGGADYTHYRVITLNTDDQATIDAKMTELNKGEIIKDSCR